MTVLVTGGAGYIGSHTVRLLREQGESVVVLDSLVTGHQAAIGDTPLIIGDIADEHLLDRLFAEYEVDAIIHFAAYKAPGESMADPGKYFDNNVCGTLSLLRAMTRYGTDTLVFSSSCSVYGTPTDLPVSESHPLHPESPYAASKHIVEQFLQWYDTCHNIRYCSLRYFNAAGAALDALIGENWFDTLNLIPLLMKAALERRSAVPIYGTDYPTPDGTAIRDYIHVLDLADAHLRALNYLRTVKRSEIINVGTGKGSSVREILDLIQHVSGTKVPVVYTGRRPGDPVAIWADNTKARSTLGWSPQYTLEDIIRTAWQWHSTHLDEYTTP